jgi:hypothetical protein
VRIIGEAFGFVIIKNIYKNKNFSIKN